MFSVWFKHIFKGQSWEDKYDNYQIWYLCQVAKAVTTLIENTLVIAISFIVAIGQIMHKMSTCDKNWEVPEK